MTIQLYDLCAAPKRDADPAAVKFVMRAPLPVIADYLKLRKEAVQRIERETASAGMPCFLYGDREKVHAVWQAIKELGVNADR